MSSTAIIQGGNSPESWHTITIKQFYKKKQDNNNKQRENKDLRFHGINFRFLLLCWGESVTVLRADRWSVVHNLKFALWCCL
jgi:hypothetical protein